MKQVLDLRPVYHRRETGSAPTSSCAGWHCSLIRVIETRPGRPGTGPARTCSACTRSPGLAPGTFRQATDPTQSQRDIYTALGLDLPKKIIAIQPATPPAP